MFSASEQWASGPLSCTFPGFSFPGGLRASSVIKKGATGYFEKGRRKSLVKIGRAGRG
jgi:hypothetical protein